ncbi:MAG: flagellin [Gammaproteobacteria bacterium]|nr:flagellin [Gammaproteobacteria bacterium]MDH5730790.1 flagellin [Gammaproteobacteria bacterium]
MPQVVNTNVMSLNSQRNLNRSQSSMAISLQRLSSGLRINSAKDDAAGLAISTRFTSKIDGLNQAARNAADGVSLAQTAEGALSEVAANLQRIRVLAIQSANDTNSSSDRASLEAEVTAIKTEVTRVLDGTTFNGVAILGATATIGFHVGADSASATNRINVSTFAVKNNASVAMGLSASILTVTDALSAIDRIDFALDAVSSIRATYGTVQNRFESVIRNNQNVAENLSASRSRIQDADFAIESAELTRTQILQQAGVAMLSQANSIPQNVLSLIG